MNHICLSLVIAYVLCMFIDAKVIKLHFLLQLTVNGRATPFIKKEVKLSPASVNH